jgi:hypothetical protein
VHEDAVIMGVWNLVSLLFPFVRDMLLGESSLPYALKTNKLRVLLLFLLMFCLGWTLYSIPRLVEMAAEQVRLEHRVRDLTNHQASSLDETYIERQPAVSQPLITEADRAVPVKPGDPDQPSQAPPPATAIPNDPDFKVRQQAWITSLGDSRSRQ